MAAGFLRRVAVAVAAGRSLLGVTALAAPSLVARPWVPDSASPAARVLGRALGGRDLALGAGALAALLPWAAPGTPGPQATPAVPGAAVWVSLGALADAGDVLATCANWGRLPPAGRWLVVMAAGGGAVAGAAAAWSLASGGAADAA